MDRQLDLKPADNTSLKFRIMPMNWGALQNQYRRFYLKVTLAFWIKFYKGKNRDNLTRLSGFSIGLVVLGCSGLSTETESKSSAAVYSATALEGE